MEPKASVLTRLPRQRRFAAQLNGTICRLIASPRSACWIPTFIASSRAGLPFHDSETALFFGVPRTRAREGGNSKAGSRWGGSRILKSRRETVIVCFLSFKNHL